MKAIAYSIKPNEKESLVLANGKKHDLTLISNELNLRTISYAMGKQAVVISPYDILDEHILRELKHIGITRIITRSTTTTHIDVKKATQMGFKIANVMNAAQASNNLSHAVILNLDSWENGTCLNENCCCSESCDFKKMNSKSYTGHG